MSYFLSFSDDSGTRPNLNSQPGTCFVANKRDNGPRNFNHNNVKREHQYLDPHGYNLPMIPSDKDGRPFNMPNHLESLRGLTDVSFTILICSRTVLLYRHRTYLDNLSQI